MESIEVYDIVDTLLTQPSQLAQPKPQVDEYSDYIETDHYGIDELILQFFNLCI